MVKWVKGRLHRGLVLRCAKSMMQIWVNLSLFCSFHWRPHDMWVSEELWEESGRRRWDFFYVNFNRISHEFTAFCRSLSAVRLWQRDWSTTRPWQAMNLAFEQHWWYRGSGLVFGEDGEDPEEPVMSGEVRQYRSADRASRRWNGEMSERKTTQRIGAEMCQVHDADLSEFELVLFISLETTWYVSIRGTMRRKREKALRFLLCEFQ